MSRWSDLYENHGYSTSWESLKESVDQAKLDDESVQTSAQELSRLRKAVKYIDGLLESMDPELIPSATWSNFEGQSTAVKQQLDQFASNRNVRHLKSANDHVDNLLTYTRPYMVAEGNAAKALRDAAVGAAKDIEKRFSELEEEVLRVYDSINRYRDNAVAELDSIAEIHKRLEYYEKQVFGEEEVEGIEQKVEDFVNKLSKSYEEIDSYHEEIFGESGQSGSIKQEVASAKDDVLEDKSSINALLSEVREKVDKLSHFYTKIFGNSDGDEDAKGLAGELKVRQDELEQFEHEQKERYEALNNEINSLLPGATSAGLASAYHEMKRSFDKPVRNASRMFYGAVAGMVFLSLLLSREIFSADSLAALYQADWGATLKIFFYKLPFYAPIIWLGLYASKRRSESQRLQQEYAHKEALAKSYHSYKQQIEELGADDTEMLKSLIVRAIDTIAHNASDTLDKKHGDKHPIQDIADIVERNLPIKNER